MIRHILSDTKGYAVNSARHSAKVPILSNGRSVSELANPGRVGVMTKKSAIDG